ncbi:hypothetical protein [Bacteroides sp.]|uniref:helix-turn-helix transcriptional regulator n=1 Tax=Bacteroides sp. TaxID=29523 RepID=UPI0026146196|nr:hypothetical protein [Bacteroides sp.]MDD3037951.1 hypothetical protein [Bacteroides sp.]
MDRFEAHIIAGGEVEIRLLDKGEFFLLDSDRGMEFSSALLREIGLQYPSMIKAVEQKIKQGNRSLYAVMKEQRRIYLNRVVYTICSCCFGEEDEQPDFDGMRFNMEFPRQCRDAKYCPWNGYSERNKDSFLVVCGAKREFGLSSGERRVLLNLQNGITNIEIMADVMCVTKANIWKYMTNIHKKTGVKTLPELVELVREERIWRQI